MSTEANSQHNLLNGDYRFAKSSSPRSHQDHLTPNKPSGLARAAKSTTMQLIANAADEDGESNISTESDEEITEDHESSAGSKDSIVSPPCALVYSLN
jgi:hypothetical protein